MVTTTEAMIDWEDVVSSPLLSRCHAVCVVHEAQVFLHGGLSSLRQSGQPLSSLVRWSPDTNTVTLVDTAGPALSHHTANVVGDVMVLTGGWDGKNRSSKLHAVNLKTNQWLQLEHLEKISRPPFGLSGHSSTMIRSSLFCVLGREGGLKIQRRFGDIFLLHLSVDPGEGVGTYYWEEAPVKTKSRSGHTALLAPSLRQGGDLYGLFVLGGRDDETIHKCGQWTLEEVEDTRQDNPHLLHQIRKSLTESEASGQCQPTALRYHTMAAITGRCVVVVGGEHFKGRVEHCSDPRSGPRFIVLLLQRSNTMKIFQHSEALDQ